MRPPIASPRAWEETTARNPGRNPMKAASEVMAKVIDRVIQATCVIGLVGAALTLTSLRATASSHREAPLITEMPKVDGTDFYMFRSYESSRSGFVTLIANYYPLQDPFGGPNYFLLDPAARHDINIDNDGDAKPEIIFSFQSPTHATTLPCRSRAKMLRFR
jgi:hypothetical protein